MFGLAVSPQSFPVPPGILNAERIMGVDPKMAGKSGRNETNGDAVGPLIERIAEDADRQAFAELFAQMAPRVKAFALKGGASPEMADELAQETMIAVWRFAKRYDADRSSGTTWIYAIARNKRIDLFRKEHRPEIDPEDPAIKAREPDTAEQILSRNSDASMLKRHLDELPPEQASLIRMAFIEEKSHGAIAVETNLALGTVKSRIRLGLSRLRASLSGFEQ